jgi:hypothetical protein
MEKLMPGDTHAIPYSFGEAREAITIASQNMKSAEDFTRKAHEDAAAAERAYRVALAKRIVEIHAEGSAWTVCQDLARGDRSVADLRYRRDVAEGVKEAAQSSTWRHTADRRDLSKLVDWSMRVAPLGQMEDPSEMRRAV